MRAFGSFGFQRAKIRYNQEPDKKDLFYHLVNVSDVPYSCVLRSAEFRSRHTTLIHKNRPSR